MIDSSDVILHVLDARDPVGTRCRHVEKYLSTEAPHKHLIFVLNKIDLVPSSTAVSTTILYCITSHILGTPRFLLGVPQGFCQDASAHSCATAMEVVRYIPGRSISTSNFSGLVIRLGIVILRLGVLAPDTGRVSYELKTAAPFTG